MLDKTHCLKEKDTSQKCIVKCMEEHVILGFQLCFVCYNSRVCKRLSLGSRPELSCITTLQFSRFLQQLPRDLFRFEVRAVDANRRSELRTRRHSQPISLSDIRWTWATQFLQNFVIETALALIVVRRGEPRDSIRLSENATNLERFELINREFFFYDSIFTTLLKANIFKN